VGANPLRPSLAPLAQIATSADGGDAAAPPVAASWSSGASLPDVAAGHGTASGPTASASWQLPSASAAPVTASSMPNEIIFPPLGADPAAAPWERTATPPAASLQRLAVGVGPHQASAPSPSLALARPVAAVGASAAAVSSSAWSTAASAPASQPAPVAQRAASGSTALPAITATPVVQRVDGAAPPAPTPSGEHHSDAELDELAKSLFGRIRQHLRSEILSDREARGTPFDPF
jgi:hypothetical protein